jgi:uncharacterized protein YjbI with pentapeptide repeats
MAMDSSSEIPEVVGQSSPDPTTLLAKTTSAASSTFLHSVALSASLASTLSQSAHASLDGAGHPHRAGDRLGGAGRAAPVEHGCAEESSLSFIEHQGDRCVVAHAAMLSLLPCDLGFCQTAQVDPNGRVPWEIERCRHRVDDARCRAVAITENECFRHAPQRERNRVLAGVAAGKEVTFTRGLTIDGELLGDLVTGAASANNERPTLVAADFSGATFVNVASIEGITFVGGVSFEGTVFEQPLLMVDCTIEGDAYFSRARFRSNAFFCDVHFSRGTFERVMFDRGADFSGCDFGSLSLYGTQSRDTLALPGVVVRGEASLGPVFSTGVIRLDGATFQGIATVDVAARELTCLGTTFERAAMLRVRRALVVLDHAVFRQPSSLAANVGVFERAVADLDEGDLFDESRLDDVGLPQQPSLVSLSMVDTSYLSLSGVNLSACLFRGARNLDQLRIEGRRTLGRTPRGVLWSRDWPPVRWWTWRRVVADESVWRAAVDTTEEEAEAAAKSLTDLSRWHPPPLHDLLSDRSYIIVSESMAFDPASISEIYRSLRKADEDSGNEPAAADFYYGEMEMRRAAPECPRPERFLLLLYWLVSGYGLRASRALAALLVTICVLAAGLDAWGFAAPASWIEALLYSANSTVSLLRAPERDLSVGGQVMDIALRLLGPLFFGLFLLALRGRVKR